MQHTDFEPGQHSGVLHHGTLNTYLENNCTKKVEDKKTKTTVGGGVVVSPGHSVCTCSPRAFSRLARAPTTAAVTEENNRTEMKNTRT